MKRKRWQQFVAAILCGIILFSNSGIQSYATEYMQEEQAGNFILTAATSRQTLIEPAVIEYTAGQTIREALFASRFTFDTEESSGFITSIEEVSGSYSIVCSDGGYNLDRSPEGITVVEFTGLTGSDLPSAENGLEIRTALIIKMSEYLSAENNVQKYTPAATAYEEALIGLRTENADMEALKAALDAAISEYEEMLSSDKKQITIEAVQGDLVLENPHCVFEDSYGSITTFDGNQGELIPETYTFCISDDNKNRVEGTITVSDNTTLRVQLPYGEWFGKLTLGRKEESTAESETIPYTYTQDFENNSAEYFIPDVAEDIFWGIERGAQTPETAVPYACYINTNNYDTSNDGKSWNTLNLTLKRLLTEGMEGKSFVLEARNAYETPDGDIYQMIQAFDVKITRIPTCLDISIKDGNGTSVFNEFHPEITNYAFNVTNNVLDISAIVSDIENYDVSIEAENIISDTVIQLSEGENVFSVIVSHSSGQTNTYTFTVTLLNSVNVSLNVPEGVSAIIYNTDGQAILPLEDSFEYALIPDSIYYYISTIDEEYHTTQSFTASENLVVEVAKPEAEAVLTNFAIYDKSNKSNRKQFECDKTFSSSVYVYNYIVSDAYSSIYAQATASDDYTVTAEYETTYSTAFYKPGAMYSKVIDKKVSTTEGCTSLSYSLITGGFQRFINLHVWKQVGDVTYYQDYRLTLQRSLHLSDLQLFDNEESITLLNKEGNLEKFDRDIYEYYVNISAGTQQVQVDGKFINESDANVLCGGYSAEIEGKVYDKLSDAVITLDPELVQETKEFKIYHQDDSSIGSTYTIHFTKQEPVKVVFDVTPQDAIIFMVNQMTNTPVFAENGVFELKPGVPYSYIITANGYLSQKVTDYIVDGNEVITVSVTMKKAPAGKELFQLESKHPSFKFDNNNGIITDKTPITSDDAVLYWANNQFKGTCGHPILVDGYLYVYDDERIYKLDTITGETVAVSKDAFVRKSDFAIQTMTYGDGMIFVGLSKGAIQAFDAYTLESLWVYKDDLGGQANSTITYHNGYIYTGFWNGETAEANYVCVSVTDENPEECFEEKIASWVHKNKGGYYWVGAYVTEDFLLVGSDDGEDGYRKGYASILSIEPSSGRIIDQKKLPHVGDIRCAITYDTETGDYYFTSKGGFFYRISVDEDGTFAEDSLKHIELSNGTPTPSMSTSTPTIYNGRAYVGVAGEGQFSPYTGHNISVLDLESMKVAYTVPTQGYPQTSGVLTTAYEESEGKVYVYFFDNYKPGKLRVLSDKPGQTKMNEYTAETYSVSGKDKTVNAGYVVFSPNGAQDEYALCTPIVDEYGTLYFRNDSNYMMAVGQAIEKLEVTKLPDKKKYIAGEIFDPAGMEVTATYKNGLTRDVTDYVSYSTASLTEDDTDFAITFEHVLYQDKNGVAGEEYTAPIAKIDLTIITDSFIIEEIPAQTYSGYALKPKPAVYNNGILLKEGTDYTLSYKNNTNAGIAQITVKGKGNFADSITAEFEILPKNILDSDISITCSDMIYNGKEQKSYPIVKFGKNTLKKDRDYSVEFSEEIIGPGTVTVKITGKGNYTGNTDSNPISYRITDKNIAKAVFVVKNCVYSGSAEIPVKPEITVYADKKAQSNKIPLTEAVLNEIGTYTEGDYSVECLNNYKAGKSTLLITGQGEYGGTKTFSYTISPKNIAVDSVIAEIKDTSVYDGMEQKPQVVVYDVVNGENILLEEGSDYIVKYSNNINAADENAKKAPTITITGKGNYTGSRQLKFTILPLELKQDMDGLLISVPDAKYNKKAQKTKVIVKLGEKTLKSGTDYTVTYKNNIDVSETDPAVIITGNKNYTGELTESFRIYESSISSFIIDVIPKQNYTPHEETEPDVVVYKNKAEQKKGPDYALKYGYDYLISGYTDNYKSGTGKVTIEGCGAYGGTKTFSFQIQKRNFDNVEMVLDNKEFIYSGNAIKPTITLIDINGDSVYTLIENVDYTVKYSNNINAAKADIGSKKAPTITVTGKGNYTGTFKEYFTIHPKDIDSTDLAVTVKDVVFNQKKADSTTGITTTFTIKNGKTTLKNKNHYVILKYMNNKTLGEKNRYDSPTIVIEGKGNFTGTRNLEFRIYQTDISKASVKVEKQYYTGYEVRPLPTSVTLKIGKETITLNSKDYKISYSNNMKCGSGKITITGIGMYGGSKTVTFKIVPKLIK